VEEKECTSALVKIGEGQTTPAIFYHDKFFGGQPKKVTSDMRVIQLSQAALPFGPSRLLKK
jgi:hypothetical protein